MMPLCVNDYMKYKKRFGRRVFLAIASANPQEAGFILLLR